MNGFLRGALWPVLSVIALVPALAGCGGGGGGNGSNSPGASAPTAVVQALDARGGPYAVACSNIVQDFSRLAAGEDVTSYWEGLPDNGRPRYVTDLLADPANTLIATVTAPQEIAAGLRRRCEEQVADAIAPLNAFFARVSCRRVRRRRMRN